MHVIFVKFCIRTFIIFLSLNNHRYSIKSISNVCILLLIHNKAIFEISKNYDFFYFKSLFHKMRFQNKFICLAFDLIWFRFEISKNYVFFYLQVFFIKWGSKLNSYFSILVILCLLVWFFFFFFFCWTLGSVGLQAYNSFNTM